MKGEPVSYKYTTNLEWTTEKKGILKSKSKPDIQIACPPEFGGHAGIWSPEDLFLASVEVCILTTFLWFIKKEDIDIAYYTSNAIGVVEMVGGIFKFSTIDIKIKVGMANKEDEIVLQKIFKKVKRACLISNSIDTEVNLYPELQIV